MGGDLLCHNNFRFSDSRVRCGCQTWGVVGLGVICCNAAWGVLRDPHLKHFSYFEVVFFLVLIFSVLMTHKLMASPDPRLGVLCLVLTSSLPESRWEGERYRLHLWTITMGFDITALDRLFFRAQNIISWMGDCLYYYVLLGVSSVSKNPYRCN